MANRFWVGGTDNWNATAGSKWALTSGGAGGEAVPTTSDDVFFNAASGANTITVSSSSSAKSITFTGFTGTFAGSSNIAIQGNFTLVSGMTFSWSGTLTFTGGTTDTLTSAGKTFSGIITVNSTSTTLTLADDLTSSNIITCSNGSFSAANHNMTVSRFRATSASAQTITLGSGTWTITGTGAVWDMTGAGTSVSAGTSTIKINDSSSSSKNFNGLDQSYNNLWLTGGGTGTFVITGSNTFADFKVDTPPMTVNFTAGTTQTVTTFTVNGSGANLQTLQSTSGGSAWNLSCASGSIVCSKVSLQDSHAAGGASFLATGSTNVSGNTGWVFLQGGLLRQNAVDGINSRFFGDPLATT